MSVDHLDPTLLRSADAAYTPIAPFDNWLSLHIARDAWDEARQRLDEARQASSSDDLRRTVAATMRAAAIDTGAIEGLYDVDRGFTISVATQSIAWQAALNEKGASVRKFFEAQLHAYELALDTATQRIPVSEAWIRRLHEELCRPQKTVRVLTDLGWQDQEFEAGRYKRLPNHPWTDDGVIHSYAPVADTPAEMHRLVEQLHSRAFEEAHPVLQAAYAHYGLVAIHPFQDGNGRVARALASVYLYRALSLPLVIFSDQKQEYFEALADADAGRRQGLVDFIQERCLDTMQLVTEGIGSAIAEQLAGLRQLLTAHGGLSHAEMDEIGYRLLELVAKITNDRLQELSVPDGVQLSFQTQPHAELPIDSGYRALVSRGKPSGRVLGQMTSPVYAFTEVYLDVVIALDKDARLPFRLRANKTDTWLDIRLRDVHPEASAMLRLRLHNWIDRVLAMVLGRLLDDARQKLNDQSS